MTVKRMKDPLGLLPDNLHIEPTPETMFEDISAELEQINRNTLGSRIARLRRHPQLVPYTDELRALAVEKGLGIRDVEDDWELRARVAEAELAALYFDAESLPARTRSQTSQKAAAAKVASDPKTQAKAKAFELWRQWQAGQTLHKSGAAFALHVVNSLPIESTKTVERWITKWRRATKK